MFDSIQEEREALKEAVEFVDANYNSEMTLETKGLVINACNLIKMCGSESQYIHYSLIQNRVRFSM